MAMTRRKIMRASLLFGTTLSLVLTLAAFTFAGEIHEAVAQGQLQTVRELLKTSPQMANEVSERGFTALHLATNSAHIAIMKLLLDSGADINVEDRDGDAPVHWAAYAGQDEAMQLLLERKADSKARNRQGWTALMWTAARGHASTAELLVAAGLKVNTSDTKGSTPLHEAAVNGHNDVVKLLIAHGARVNATDEWGDCPLHMASWAGNLKVAELLLAAGAKVDAVNRSGATPLAKAARADRDDIVALLRSKGAKEPTASARSDASPSPRQSRISSLKITILYDNYLHTEGTQTDWGFSCLIEGPEKTILFDTGTQPDILMHNVESLKVDLTTVDTIVLSHAHGDHTNGIFRVLELVPDVPVYLPQSFPYDFVRRVEHSGGNVIPVNEPVQICAGVHLTGEMGDQIKEQSLVADTTSGLVVVTGCSHPGIDLIAKRAREIADRKITLVVGGFHLMRHSEEQLQAIVANLRSAGVERCAATHCTGDNAIAFFKKAFEKSYVPAGTGQVFVIGESP
jgi:7,8-dihydropterin-6-yl-methyl-4-(beta-D-ribofuranosyl)aminobenzene 5'-phosphate synthase